MSNFEREIDIRWSDTDPNRHVRHSAYYDFGAHVRIRFFAENGFDSDRMADLNFGPIVFKEECSFIKEIHPNETIRINFLRGEMRPDGSRWVIHHEIFNKNDEKCAHLTLKGAWMDLKLRKLTIPPAGLAQAFLGLPEGEYYEYQKNKN
ncbi:MAG: acyl-CoA thioesterase [Bacteroidia bacterium]|nr:acyl-CoA thioesterase [Bacteroidia bacterium]